MIYIKKELFVKKGQQTGRKAFVGSWEGAMNIVFVRHGDPDYKNDTLTEKGVREAKLLAGRIGKITDADFYVSPLGRARKTAEIALEGRNIEPVVLPWMREFYYPVVNPTTGKKGIGWDFMPSAWTEIPELYDKTGWLENEIYANSETPEKYREVISEFDSFLEKYGYFRHGNYYKAKPGSDKTVVIFCHLGVQFLLIGHLTGISPVVLWHGFFVATGSVTVINTEEREPQNASFRVRTFGDTSHLYNTDEPVSDAGIFPRKSFIV